jgi:HK97 family phage portal protein
MGAFQFWRRLMFHALLWSNAYCLIVRNGQGQPIELLPLLPDRTSPRREKDGTLFYVSEIDGNLEAFAASNILHIEQMSINGMADCQLVYKARESFALSLAAEEFASKYFRYGGRIGGILEVPAGMTKKGADNLEAGYRKTYEKVDNAFKTVILRDGAKFHQAQFTPEQTQMVAARQEQVKEIARWFNLPPHKLGDDSKASYNSLEQENRAYLNGCLSHWLNAIQSECWLKLLSPAEQEANTHFIEYNVRGLIAADIATQYQIFRTGIEAGILSPDEVRAMQNMNPRPDGMGDKYLRPLNMEYADTAQDPVIDETPADDVDLDNMEAQRAAWQMLDQSVEKFTAYLMRKVNRELDRKTINRFLHWIKENLSDEKQKMAADIQLPAQMIAGLQRSNAEELIESISVGLFDDLAYEFSHAFEITEKESMQRAMQNITKEFVANCVEKYRGRIENA